MTEGDHKQTLHPIEAAERQRHLLLRIVRAAFVILLVTVTLLNILRVSQESGPTDVQLAIGWYIPLGMAFTLAAVVIAVDLLTPNKKISTLVSVFLGLLAGMAATIALSFVIDLLAATYDIRRPDPAKADYIYQIDFIATTKIVLGICLSYLGITIVLQTQDDFRLVIPYVEFSKQIRGPRPLLLDSSALIDARIVDVGATGIVQYPLVVPRFVVGELQALADSGDRMKRAKGRRGLDVIAKLQRSTTLDVSIDETPIPAKAVDQMLVELAKRMPAAIVTTDLGLKRIAGIQGVAVLNLNDVANALKPSLIPGEQLSLRLLKPGEQSGQAVGYLADGTMVVAEDGAAHVGQDVTLVVTSSLQTSAGRLIFGRLAEADQGAPATHGPSPPEAGGGAPTLEIESAGVAPAPEPAPAPDLPPAPRKPGPFPPNPPSRFNRARNPRR